MENIFMENTFMENTFVENTLMDNLTSQLFKVIIVIQNSG